MRIYCVNAVPRNKIGSGRKKHVVILRHFITSHGQSTRGFHLTVNACTNPGNRNCGKPPNPAKSPLKRSKLKERLSWLSFTKGKKRVEWVFTFWTHVVKYDIINTLLDTRGTKRFLRLAASMSDDWAARHDELESVLEELAFFMDNEFIESAILVRNKTILKDNHNPRGSSFHHVDFHFSW